MKVILLAYTQLNPHLDALPAELMQGKGTPQENVIEYAARVCYRSVARMGNSASFIEARIKEQHEDVIEHSAATYFIDGISRACSHQLVRHRLASFSQESQRYTELGENAEFIVPDAIANNPQAKAIWDRMIGGIEDAYRELRDMGMRKEDARFLLPNATATRLVMSMNFRSLRHFFWMRCDKAAQWEIQELARAMLRLTYPLAPSVFQDIVDVYKLHDVVGLAAPEAA